MVGTAKLVTALHGADGFLAFHAGGFEPADGFFQKTRPDLVLAGAGLGPDQAIKLFPVAVKKDKGNDPGDEFVVVGEGDAVVLKVVAPPSLDELGGLLRAARREARSAGMKRSDVAKAVAQVRRARG